MGRGRTAWCLGQADLFCEVEVSAAGVGYATSDEKRRRAGRPKAVCSERVAAQKDSVCIVARILKESCYFALLLPFSLLRRTFDTD